MEPPSGAPNVIQLFQVITTQKNLYLAMERTGGGSYFSPSDVVACSRRRPGDPSGRSCVPWATVTTGASCTET